MYKKVWTKCHEAICSINFFSEKGIRFDSVTGFKYGRYIITGSQVYKMNKAREVQITFFQSDGLSTKAQVKITWKDFSSRLVKGLNENVSDFTFIDMNFPQFDNIPSLQLRNGGTIAIGTEVAVIGHQYEHNNLCLKKGMVSSNVKKNGNNYIQVDTSLEKGYAGAPVIIPDTGEVAGLLGHRLNAISESRKQMMDIINNNLELLKETENKIHFNNIDPIQVLIANQNQIKRLAQELYKTASINYGLAIEISQVAEYIDIEQIENVEYR